MSFRFPCVSTIYKDLGRYDAIVEFTELSIRDFLYNAGEAEDFNSYISTKSLQHNIRVNAIDRSIFKARVAHGYIMSVYQTFELFLRTFVDDFAEVYQTSPKLDSSTDSLLLKVIKITGKRSDGINAIGEHRMKVYDYYRKARNKYSHDIMEDSKVEKSFQEVAYFKETITNDYPKVVAPNEYDKMSFEDFILFSRVVKDIAVRLSDFAAPDDAAIAKYYLAKRSFPELCQNPTRRTNSLISHMRNNYGIEFERANYIVSLIMSH